MPYCTDDAPVHGLPVHRELRVHRDDHEIQLLQRRVVQIQCPIIEDVHFGAFQQPNLRELALHSVDLATLLAVHKLNRSRLIEIQRVANLSWARTERLAGDVRRRRAL
jgi:hypothetical protein